MLPYIQKYFMPVIELRMLKYRDYLGLSKWAPHSQKGPYKREVVGMSERTEDATLLPWKMEDGPQAKECRGPLEARKGKETDFPLEPPEGRQLCRPIVDF